jgi:hypothetical protein
MKLDELSRLLRASDPAAVTVPQPVLDRVIRQATGLSWAAWTVPHRTCFLVDRFTLFKHVEQHELDVPPDHQLPATVLLISRPPPDQMADRAAVLARCWRLLFHVAAHRELEARTPADVRERVTALGPAAFEEAKNVLIQDGHLPADATDRQAYIEFAATYFELRAFAWNLIPVCFPSLPQPKLVEKVLEHDLDHRPLFERTRLSGAPDPAPRTDDQSDEQNDFYYRLVAQARRASQANDTVAAAILHTRAARVAPAALTHPAHDAAVREVHRLVARLEPTLHLDPAAIDGWKAVLPQLLDKADQGARPVEAAILYDLQRACLDAEQPTYALDLVEWLASGGHRPIRRRLDSQPYVRVPAHLRRATERLAAARLSDADRQSLAGLLRAAQQAAEDRLRARFRPTLTDALQDAGLTAESLPEQAARAKTVEELLDRIVATGFLTYADLRDAIARGQVKLPDLGGTDEYLRGDLLLRLDRRLGTLLDGVYRRSEFYSRWLERGTSFLFGTPAGRWATRNVVLPVGGAFLVGQFLWLMVYETTQPSAEVRLAAAAVTGPAVQTAEPRFLGGWNADLRFHLGWLALAVVFFVLVRSAAARAAVRAVGDALYGAGRLLLWEVPVRVWRHAGIRAVLGSVPVRLGWDYGVKPAALSGLLWVSFPMLWSAGWAARVVTFLAAAFVLNLQAGLAVQALLAQTVGELVALIRGGLIPGVVRAVGQFFRDLTGAVEWVLARADDWLRLRGGGGPLSVVGRAVASLAWAPVAFLLRFYLIVLIEPMLNPLKLPLSILFAKFVYPLMTIAGLFEISRPVEGDFTDITIKAAGVESLAGIGVPWWFAFGLLVSTYYLLPDAVTFLFWETRENWKLYRANRPAHLRAEAVGSHGEGVVGLLRAGFHTGTVPRRFARLRAAEREGGRTGDWTEARRHRAALRDVADGVRRFVGRELVAVLNPANPWGGRSVFVGDVHLGTNRIRVELGLLGSAKPAVLEFEDRSGWLVAGWADPGWVTDLPAAPARALENTLAYLYKRAGVELVREQVRAGLPATAERFDVVPSGLLVTFPGGPLLYDLRHRPGDLRPRTPDGLKPAAGPILDPAAVHFAGTKLTWDAWVRAWPAAGGDGPPPAFGPADHGRYLLPPRPAMAAETVEFTPDRLAAALAAGAG